MNLGSSNYIHSWIAQHVSFFFINSRRSDSSELSPSIESSSQTQNTRPQNRRWRGNGENTLGVSEGS